MCKAITFLLFNSVIPYTTDIGKESRFAYGGIGAVVHSRAVIGDRVIIGQNTTIGRSLDSEDIPTIGNDVYISAGARVIGKINIGNNVIIGANAVVNKDVPNNSVVVGVPAKVIKTLDCSIWSLFANIKWKSGGGLISVCLYGFFQRLFLLRRESSNLRIRFFYGYY